MLETSATFDEPDFLSLSAEIVSAYVSRNALNTSDLPKLIGDVHRALSGLNSEPVLLGHPPREPAVAVRRSVGDAAIICLEDGLKFKSLKRHLATHHQMTPDKYRAKWNLPKDYPMVAPAYSRQRSNLAKAAGLGRTGRAERKRRS